MLKSNLLSQIKRSIPVKGSFLEKDRAYDSDPVDERRKQKEVELIAPH